jgi:5-amino-6-(5-phosphoribosylamino)uracil reductase
LRAKKGRSMSERPYVTLSCAMSLDGYLDSARSRRLVMSNEADLDRVDEQRARHDAIMVGASTVRRDDPRLLVKNEERRRRRVAEGRRSSPLKVTVTATGDLPVEAAFFTAGDVPRLVYCPRQCEDRVRARLRDRATVVGLADNLPMSELLDDLGERRAVRRLMVEGGGTVLTQFLAADLVDELQLVIAPFFVGDARAPRFIGPGSFPWTPAHRATLYSTQQIGDVVLLRYALSDRFGAFDDTGDGDGAGSPEAAAARPDGTRASGS